MYRKPDSFDAIHTDAGAPSSKERLLAEAKAWAKKLADGDEFDFSPERRQEMYAAIEAADVAEANAAAGVMNPAEISSAMGSVEASLSIISNDVNRLAQAVEAAKNDAVRNRMQVQLDRARDLKQRLEVERLELSKVQEDRKVTSVLDLNGDGRVTDDLLRLYFAATIMKTAVASVVGLHAAEQEVLNMRPVPTVKKAPAEELDDYAKGSPVGKGHTPRASLRGVSAGVVSRPDIDQPKPSSRGVLHDALDITD